MKGVRRCPTLPHSVGCSTIGADRLSFRVRDGSGRFPVAMAAVTLPAGAPPPRTPGSCGPVVRGNRVWFPAKLYQTTHTLTLGVDRVNAAPLSGGLRPHDSRKACESCVASDIAQWTRSFFVVSPRPISTSHLHTLLCFQFWPINPMVCGGPYPLEGGEKPHLGTGFPLRCFQRLSLPNVANQQCPWRDNWHTRGSSVPVLSY